MQSVVWNEAVKINGADPDFHRRDLWEAIQSRRFPGMGAAACNSSMRSLPISFEFDVLDATKLIPEEEVPMRRVGRMVLDRCVDNFFAETEQVAFCTAEHRAGRGLLAMTRCCKGATSPTSTLS